jgi:hypothetical protein
MAAALTDDEIERAGMQALMDALGPAGMLRFLQRFRPGRGDYTADRHRWLKDLTLEDLIREARQLDAR